MLVLLPFLGWWAAVVMAILLVLVYIDPDGYIWLCRKTARLWPRRRQFDSERWSLILLAICFVLTLGISWVGAFADGDIHGTADAIFAGIEATFAHLEGDSGDFRDYAANIGNCALWASYILSAAIPFLTVLTALQLLWRYLPHHVPIFAETWYIFSELQPNSIRMARSIHENLEASGETGVFIFLRSPRGKQEADTLAELKDIRYHLYPKTERELLRLRHRRSRTLRFFFLTENTDENFNRMSDFLDAVRERSLFRPGRANSEDFNRQELYLLSETESASMLIDHLRRKLYDNGQRLDVFADTELRLLDRFRATSYDLLRRQPLQSLARDDALRILVLGFGKIGREFFRAACHMGVIHNCRTTFTLCDLDIQTKQARFLPQCPELDQSVDFQFRTLDADTHELDNLVQTMDYHFILVALGDDERNIRVASRLKQHYRRRRFESLIPGGAANYQPQIAVNVEDSIKHAYTEQLWKTEETGESVDLPLHVFGGLDQTFTTEVLMPRNYWKAARWIHEVLLENGSDRNRLWSEYERRSSFACAAHAACYPPELCARKPDALRDTEHRRWMAYVRSEGMIYARRELMDAYFAPIGWRHVDILGKLSPCLTPAPQELRELWEHLNDLPGNKYQGKKSFLQRDELLIRNAANIQSILKTGVCPSTTNPPTP